MAASKVLVAAAALLCLLVAAGPRDAAAAITCGQVASGIAPCFKYVTGAAPFPGGPCCSGIRGINSAAQTPADRQAACGCLKSLAGRFNGFKPQLAAGLPGKCGVNVGYPISTSTDCSKVH